MHPVLSRWHGAAPPSPVRWLLRILLILSILPEAAAAEEVPEDAGAASPVDFERHVLPILRESCFRCHGEKQQKSGLRLDVRAAALAGGDSGKRAIVPGEPEESRLIALVGGADPEGVMPPSGAPLDAAQVRLLRRWIEQGARWPDALSGESRERHWAYVKPVRPEPPPVRPGAVARNPIDAFVLTRLEKEGLEPAPEADPASLLRRVSLDVTGLPPSVEEVDQFLADTRPDAYEKAVDRLLDSSAYGERWARVWLDLARYADSQGYEKDNRRSIWRYRDWVIDALNRDLRFDEFTVEQLAGDLIPGATLEQLVATAFHRNTMTNTEGGTDNEEFRTAAVVDRVNTTFQVWMGTTMGCAQCHSHKYDPFTQKDYYRFFAFLNGTEDADQDDDSPVIAAPTREEAVRAEDMTREITRLDAWLSAGEEKPGQDPSQTPETVKARVEELKAAMPKPATVPVLRELARPRPTNVLVRGSYLTKGEEVEPGVPAVLHPFPEGAPLDRLGMARWIVHPDNPLTARVTVNRIWEQYFGRGIVETSEDFGTRGDLPTHPELLDWLATELQRLDWSLKSLHRLIVCSATYRRSSRSTSILRERDPYNRLLSRGPRARLDAETIRDQALAVSGLLSRKIGGPSVMPPQPEGTWFSPYSGDKWVISEGEDRYRRGIYTFWRRTAPYPSFITFDAPSREICVAKRSRTNTPLQALTLLNDPVYVECARALALRMLREAGPGPEARVQHGFRTCLARHPRPGETGRLLSLLQGEIESFRADVEAARTLVSGQPGAGETGIDLPELAGWTVVANVLLNLDEFITKG